MRDTIASEALELEALHEGLTRPLREISAKYFYDDHGSALFEQISELEEYYPTRTEIAILERLAGEVMQDARAAQLVELGSGAGRKIRLLLDGWRLAPESEGVCTMLDVNESFLSRSIAALAESYRGRASPRGARHGRSRGVRAERAGALAALVSRPRRRCARERERGCRRRARRQRMGVDLDRVCPSRGLYALGAHVSGLLCGLLRRRARRSVRRRVADGSRALASVVSQLVPTQLPLRVYKLSCRVVTALRARGSRPSPRTSGRAPPRWERSRTAAPAPRSEAPLASASRSRAAPIA